MCNHSITVVCVYLTIPLPSILIIKMQIIVENAITEDLHYTMKLLSPVLFHDVGKHYFAFSPHLSFIVALCHS